MTTLPQPADPTATFTATYDAWNRLVQLQEDDGSGGLETVALYRYDARRFRIVAENYVDASLSETRHQYHSADWQVLEERVGTSPITADAEQQFVWGVRYIDDLVLRDRDTTADGTLDERLYALQDANWNVLAQTESAGVVQERYGYDPYGATGVLSPTFGVRASSFFAWETTYSGYHCEQHTGLLRVRFRHHHPDLGHWTSRDPIGYRPGLNLYECVRVVNLVDPFGLESWIPFPRTGDGSPVNPVTGEVHRDTPPSIPPKPNRTATNYRDACGNCSPGLYITVFCRTMPAAGRFFWRHCYLAVRDGGRWVETISGQRDEITGRVVFADNDWDLGHLNDWPIWIEEFGDTDDTEYHLYVPFDGGSDHYCKFYDCAFREAMRRHGSFVYEQYQSNSNTFLTQIIRKCGGSVNFPYSAWGSDDL